MPVPKANQRAVNKYVKNNYDRINVTMPKGHKETIQTAAAAAGESVNAYINSAISQRMERSGGGTASETAGKDLESAQGVGVISLPSETLRAVQEAAQSAGETVSQFVKRAVSIQVQRDQASLKLGINPVTGEKQQ